MGQMMRVPQALTAKVIAMAGLAMWLVASVAAESLFKSPAGLEIKISNPQGPFFGSDYKATIQLVNRGTQRVRVVAPGVGSLHGVRTPRLYWIVRRAGGTARELPAPTPGCGNIDPLRAKEVIELGSNQSVDVSRAGPLLTLKEPGEYRVRLRYVNDPKMKWTGVPLGEHDPEAMRKVQESTPCDIVSNEIAIVARASKATR